MLKSPNVDEQIELRKYLDRASYYQDIGQVYLNNPFFRLTQDELDIFLKAPNASPLRQLIVAREAAAASEAPRYAVFCMPKSGSSFVKSALEFALELPFVTIAGFTNPRLSSYFGMNPREQELDELGIVRAILNSPNGFIAQHHTRCTMYLALQMKFFRIRSIVTLRNVLDSIVSFDEMMLSWRAAAPRAGWIYDAQFALPANYQDLDEAQRYELLGRSFGVWQINFFLSWMRCAREGAIGPLVLRYEDHILHHDVLVDRLDQGLGLTPAQRERLAAFVRNPRKVPSRFNVGVKGRGRDRIPEPTRRALSEYANMFAGEISEEDMRYLVE